MNGTDITAEDKVRQAYELAGGAPGKYVKLHEMRYTLAAEGLSLTAQDEVLIGMFRRQELNLVPQSNQQALTPGQRVTALNVGGEAKHLVLVR